jgi:hypothetical protein
MKKNLFFVLVALCACALPAFAEETPVVVNEEEGQKEVVLQDCGCSSKTKKDKPQEPKPQPK